MSPQPAPGIDADRERAGAAVCTARVLQA